MHATCVKHNIQTNIGLKRQRQRHRPLQSTCIPE